MPGQEEEEEVYMCVVYTRLKKKSKSSVEKMREINDEQVLLKVGTKGTTQIDGYLLQIVSL